MGYDPEASFRKMLDEFRHLLNNPNIERRLLMALTAEVKALVDAVAANTSASKSIEAAVALQTTQIADLKAKVDELQAKLDAGGVINAEDLAAIKASADTITETNTELAAATPANVTQP
jgi:predicted  nucleic acid-binding Zn-ribbon protein